MDKLTTLENYLNGKVRFLYTETAAKFELIVDDILFRFEREWL